MLTLRSTVAATTILAAGITAVCLIAEPRSGETRPQIPVSQPAPAEAPATTTTPAVAEEVSLPDCCGGRASTLTPAELQAQTERGEKRAQVLAAFNAWGERFAHATAEQRSEMMAEGLALAQERRLFMVYLIKTNPREALAAADKLSPLARKDLPPEIARHVEHLVSGKGDLAVLGMIGAKGSSYLRLAQIGGEQFTAYTYGKRNAPIPETNTPLIGVALGNTESVPVNGQTVERHENVLALREDKYRVLTRAEAAIQRDSEPPAAVHHCPVSGAETSANGDPTAVDVGGEVVWLCKGGHVGPFVHDAAGQLVAASGGDPQLAAAGGPGEGAGSFPSTSAGWNTGNKTWVAIVVRFPEQAANPFGSADISGSVSQAQTRFNQWSYGRVNFSSSVTPILTLPHSQAEYSSGSLGWAESAMMSDAITLANNAGYNASGANFRSLVYSSDVIGGYCGLAYVVGQDNWIKCIEPRIFNHEVGHNLGLPHANSWTPSTTNPIGAGSHCEYCGAYNCMGGDASAYDSMMRFYIRWLTYNEAHDVKTNGTYRIYDPEVTSLTAGRKHTIRIAKQAGQYYFVEFRPRATALSDSAAVNTTTMNGIRILRTDGSEQIDVTPGSASGTSDAALTVGQSFTDSAAGITITASAKGGSGSDQYMDVAVSFSAPALYSGGVYELQPQCAPGLALDVSGGSDSDGANVQIWTSHGGASQQWKIEDEGGGVWELLPLCAPGRRLDVTGAGTGNGTNAELWTDYSSANQRWALTDVGNGYFEVVPQNATGSRLDVNGGASAAGTNVQIWGTNSSPAQRWRLLATGPQNNATFALEPQCASGKRLAVAGGADANGTLVTIWDKVGVDPSQQWKLESEGDGLWELIPQCATSRRLDVTGGGTTNGTQMEIWIDGDGNNQRWSVVSTGNGYYELIPKHATGSRLDVNAAGNTNGTKVQLWQTNSSIAQRWRLFRN